MRDAFARDLRAGTRAGLLAAARRAYLSALLALTVPGVLLALILGLGRPAQVTPLLATVVLYAFSLALAGWALRRAQLLARRPELPATQAALTGAIQAATAPGVVFLMGSTLAGQAALPAGFWITALLLHGRVWTWLPAWVREPEAHAARAENLPSA